MAKQKGEMSVEERAARDRERKIMRLAREIQHRLDRDMLYAKLPEVVTAMVGASEEDEEVEMDDDVSIEYTESYDHRLTPMASLVVKTGRAYFREEQLIALLRIARALGMVGTIHASREDNYNGDRELEFALRPVSSKIGQPSEEAIAEARMRFAAEEAANAS